MFLASACNFVLSTVDEGAYLAVMGMTIHTRFVECGVRPLAETQLLADHQLMLPNIINQFIGFLVVRDWDS
jgi:hypothetical protein